MSFRFSRTRRLCQASDIRRVLTAGKKIVAGDFSLKWQFRGSEAKESRLCVVARKKQVKTSAERNRMRRLVKEFFRLHAQEFKAPVDMVVQVSNFRLIKYKEVEELFKLHLKKSGILI